MRNADRFAAAWIEVARIRRRCSRAVAGLRVALPVGLIALAGCESATGTGEDAPQKLLFISTSVASTGSTWLDRDKDIFQINTDGTGLGNLTRHPVQHYRSLSLSPDGRRIAYSRLSDCYGIWIMNTNGSAAHEVAGFQEFRCTYMPRWSPDGQRIAFTSTRDRDGFGVYVMDLDDGEFRSISHALDEGSTYYPAAWSPDGRIVFHQFTQGQPTRTWSANPDGSDLRMLFDRAGDHSPAWSPDGARLAFLSDRDGTTRLYVMRADGSELRKLSGLPGDDELDRRTVWDNDHTPWSPDGTRIVFRSFDGSSARLYIVGVDGTGLRALTGPMTDLRYNGWSHDGEWIAFTAEAAGNRDVYVLRPDGSGLRNLTASPWHDGDALWLPRR